MGTHQILSSLSRHLSPHTAGARCVTSGSPVRWAGRDSFRWWPFRVDTGVIVHVADQNIEWSTRGFFFYGWTGQPENCFLVFFCAFCTFRKVRARYWNGISRLGDDEELRFFFSLTHWRWLILCTLYQVFAFAGCVPKKGRLMHSQSWCAIELSENLEWEKWKKKKKVKNYEHH